MTEQIVKVGQREMTFDEARAGMNPQCAEVVARMFPQADTDPEQAQQFVDAYARLYRQQHGSEWNGDA